MPSILVTGGAGYIGSHTVVELLAAGHEVTVVDNFCDSSPAVPERIARIAGRAPVWVRADVRDRNALETVFEADGFDAVIHFAGLKAVGESVAEPLRYYDNNVGGAIVLLEAMARHGVKTLVFSSSATVYGDSASVPIREDAPLAPANPYGRSKLMVEGILREMAAADPAWRVAMLRYFNPVGAHESGLIGEDPGGVPNNLMPFISQVAAGRRECLSVWGDDYPTPDGTGVRDYIHVTDIASGHLAALECMPAAGVLTVNLGTGRGYSVLEMLRAFERVSGRPVPYRIAARRPGDVAVCYADPALAAERLGWRAQLDIDRMCADTWRWQSLNPQGYDKE